MTTQMSFAPDKTALIADAKAVCAEYVAEGRRFTDSDVAHQSFTIRDGVILWSRQYEGNMDYVREMKRRESLSLAQLRGLFNCLRAEVASEINAARPKETFALEGMVTLLESAKKSGLKWPKIRLDVNGRTILISIAGDRSRTPGAINVTTDGRFEERDYLGRINTDGTFDRRTGCGDDVVALLRRFADSPAEVAAEYGRLTGYCCFCQRPLDDERSTEVGYGPVCAKHYGLPWGKGATIK